VQISLQLPKAISLVFQGLLLMLLLGCDVLVNYRVERRRAAATAPVEIKPAEIKPAETSPVEIK